MKIKSALLLLLFVCLGWTGLPTTAAAAPSAQAQVEISRLMSSLATSGCRFQRNGEWYDASQARAHLQRKYDYLLKKNQVDTAEQFIQRAASQSSMTGRAYRVKCKQDELDSSVWFNRQLKLMRSGPAH